MTRVVQVVSSIENPSAGTTYALTRLCETLGRRGLDVELHALGPLPGSCAAEYRSIGYRRWPFPARLGVSRRMRTALVQAAKRADIVHNNGLWMMPNLYAGRAARIASRPQVYSVHGMLAPWSLSRSPRRKALVSFAGQGSALHGAACVHATAAREYEEIRRYGLRQPVTVIPYGIDIPTPGPVAVSERRTLLFLGRIHPVKGIEILLRAWRAVQDHFPDWDVVICGPDNEGHLAQMRQLAQALRVVRVEFIGPRYGQDKQSLIESSQLFVLPTFTENFGFVVAEALACGKPVIVTTAAPWEGLVKHRCGWWIETGVEALEHCLRQALTLDEGQLSAMGGRGRDWVAMDLSWERVGEMMDLTYQWLLGLHGKPDWVLLD